MKASVLRAAMAMADEAERRIIESGRRPPDRADLVAVLLPRAREVIRSARQLEGARWVLARAMAEADDAGEAGEAARESIVAVAAAYAAAAPRPLPAPVLAGTVPFRAGQHVVTLAAPSRDRVALPSSECS